MMGGNYGGTMMGGPSYGWMMSVAGYQWMTCAAGTPGWMRGGTLPGAMTVAGADPGTVMGALFSDAPAAGKPCHGTATRWPDPSWGQCRPGQRHHQLHRQGRYADSARQPVHVGQGVPHRRDD
jgi:hypothetical protein